ncbi:MAG: type IV conjugative transfer system protein TraL [Desulfobulbaceae bacterium]|nr:MAG: type IV conjugative transfer system protein TraL [Desulfobulbaceae bacterium]
MAKNSLTQPFPQYLSKPIQVLWFETDELVLGMFFFVLALVYGKFMWLLFFGSQYFYIRTKKKKPRGYLKHLLYVLGLIKMKNYPEFLQKEYHE